MRVSLAIIPVFILFYFVSLPSSSTHGIRYIRRTRPLNIRWVRPIFTRKIKNGRITAKNVLCRLRHHRTVVNKYNNYVKCVRRCPKNYRELYSTYWGHYCKPIDIPKGCVDQFCITCKRGFKWVFTSNYKERCVNTCPTGFKETSRTCEMCMVSDCYRCSTLWKCSKCNQGFYLQRTLMGSIVCVVRCSRGFQKKRVGGVNKCVPIEERTTEKPSTTDATPPTPTSITITTKMEENVTTTHVPTTTESTETTTMLATTTATTTPAPPEGCQDQLCMICLQGYYKFITQLGASTCVQNCPPNYTTLGTICVACSDNKCVSCPVSIAECEKCQAGYSMFVDASSITTECVRYCPPGYTKERIEGADICTKQAKQDCPVANCESCGSSSISRGCEKCKSGFILFRGSFNDHCYTSCPPQYYEVTEKDTNTSICAKCDVAFCNECSKSDICERCIEPMVLDAGTGKCRFCEPYTTYSYEDKKCIPIDLNRPDSNEIFGGPIVG